MLNSLGLFSLVYRLQLWSIRGTIHLENDDSWLNRRPATRCRRTPPQCDIPQGNRAERPRRANLNQLCVCEMFSNDSRESDNTRNA
jgi:hypothetical protein